MADKAKRILKKAAAVVFWIALWQIISMLISRELILPSPVSTVSRLCELVVTADYWESVALSMIRIVAGFIIGCAAGSLLALVCALSETAAELFSPLLSVIRSTPVASFILIAVFWIGSPRVPSFISSLIVLPIVCDSVLAGMKNPDRELVEVATVYGFSTAKRVRLILLPSAARSFLASSSTALGIAWKAGIAAEVITTTKLSIGKSLNEAKIYLETPSLFAWTLTVIILSIIAGALFNRASKRLLRALHL